MTEPTRQRSPKTPHVYFRGVNRIHINRFKAYTQILANSLTCEWPITDDPKGAQMVIEPVELTGDDKGLQLLVLADTANPQGAELWRTELSFDEQRLVRQLNKAIKKLRQGKTGTADNTSGDRTYEVCELAADQSSWANRLQALNTAAKFNAVTDFDEWYNDLFHAQVLLLVDPINPRAVQQCMALLAAKQQGDLIIEQLTVVITDDGPAGEALFDQVYAVADAATQVSTLNPTDVTQWQDFVQFL